MATAVTLQDTLADHVRLTRKRERNGFSFNIVDDDYSTIESYLRQAFKKRGSLYASDVADALGLDYGIVREVIARMMKEGKLATK